MLRHRENQAEFEAEAGHEHFRLVPRFTTERQRVVSGQFGSESFSHQSDLSGTDAVDRAQKNYQDNGCRNYKRPRFKIEYHREGAPDNRFAFCGSLPFPVRRHGASPHLMLIVGAQDDNPLLGGFVFEKADFSAEINFIEMTATVRRVDASDDRGHRIGLALSGGGFRAVAFHLGCL
jgi:hypothetical protein